MIALISIVTFLVGLLIRYHIQLARKSLALRCANAQIASDWITISKLGQENVELTGDKMTLNDRITSLRFQVESMESRLRVLSKTPPKSFWDFNLFGRK